MAIASNITLVTVSGTYVDFSGAAIAGQIKFTMNSLLRNEIADQILVPSTVTINLDSNGSFSTVLPASNDPQFSGTFTYQVEEAFTGGRSYTLSLPEGGPYNLADLAPTWVVSPQYENFVSLTDWTTLDATVQVMDSRVDQPNLRFIRSDFFQLYNTVSALTYATLKTTYATYGDIAAVYITAAELSPYQATALGYQSAAETSNNSAQVSLLSITNDKSTRVYEYWFVGG